MTYQIAYVKTNQEKGFCDWLTFHDVESYCPLSKIQVKPRGKRRFLVIERAIFPHYVYLKTVEGITNLVKLHTGFLNWLQFGDNDVACIQDGEIDVLKAREATGEFDKISKAPSLLFQKGSTVKVLVGPFAGFTGRVTKGPKRQAIADVEICGKIIKCPLAILAIAL